MEMGGGLWAAGQGFFPSSNSINVCLLKGQCELLECAEVGRRHKNRTPQRPPPKKNEK